LAAPFRPKAFSADSVRFELVRTPEDAEKLAFRGSPTVLVDGIDPFADENSPVGFTCRVFQTENGMEGSPSVAQLREVLSRT
jgi:hypothetical protein